MINTIIFLLIIYMIIGGIAIAFIVKKKPEEKKPLWQKYAVYLFLIGLVVSSLLMGRVYFLLLVGLIGIIGAFDIIKIGIKTHQSYAVISSAITIFGILYYFFFKMSYFASITELVIIYFYVLLFDAFSQIAGKLFGKRKVTTISPNKTWEGLVGGVLVTLFSVFLLHRGEGVTSKQFLFAGLLCVAFFTGDILASVYKRVCGVKDYSNLLPSHGGALDRYDSFISAGIVYQIINLIYG